MSKAEKRSNTIHILQAQAFIEAAEDIAADDEVLDDLRNDLDAELDPDGALRLDADDVLDLGEDDGLDDPVYNALVEEGNLVSSTMKATCFVKERSPHGTLQPRTYGLHKRFAL